MTPAFQESRGFLSAGRALRFSHRIASAQDEHECRELLRGAPPEVKLLAVGSGQSLGDSGLNGGHALIVTRGMNKVLELDRAAGLIRCQPGVSIGELAKHALDGPVDGRRFPFVIPGTDIVTIAGAIANDIHGKNHPLHGSFCHHVEALTLLRSTGEEMRCSATGHPDLFRATLGGLGLTGIITSVMIRLRPVRGPLLASDDTRFESLDEAFALHAASDAEYRFFWFDPFSEKGRGIFTQSRHVEGEESEAEPMGPLMRVIARLPIPSLVGGPSIWKSWYALMLSKGPSTRSQTRTYLDVLAPLGRFKRWNRLLGPRGLLHFQSVVPAAGAPRVLAGMLADCRVAGELPCIASVKEFGPLPRAGLLSFPREGITSALDFSYRGETTRRLLARLEARVIEAGGAIYPGKDATLSAAGFRRIFPEWETFAKHVDPEILFEFLAEGWGAVMKDGAARWGKMAALGLLAIYLWLAIGGLGLVMPQSGVDPSWRSVLVHAWVHGWKWGVDIIDNFGPYGFLYGQEYHPDAAGLMLGLNAALAAILVAAWFFLIRRLSLSAQIVLSVGFLLAMSGRRESFFFAFPVLLTLLHIRDDRDTALPMRVLLVMAVALSAEVKWTFFVVSVAVLALLDLDTILRRRWPWYLLLGAVTAALLHVMAGQDFRDLPSLFALTFEQAASFAETAGPAGPLWELALFIALNMVAVVAIFLCLPGPLPHRVIAWLALSGILFVSYKAGFVRHDAAHSHSSWNFLALSLLACGAAAGLRIRQPLGKLVVAATVCALGLGAYMQNRYVVPLADVYFRARPLAAGSRLAAMADWRVWKTGQDHEWRRARARVRANFPLDGLSGSADALTAFQAEILASSLDYRPHPTMQEHQATSPANIEADRAFFQSDRAADYLIYTPGTNEKRIPAAVVPVLLAEYEPGTRFKNHRILKRRSVPRSLAYGIERAGQGTWDDWISLSNAEAAGAVLRVDAATTLFGSGVSFLYRPPSVRIEMRLANGRVFRHRLPPSLAAAGILLSPFIPTSEVYESLSSRGFAAISGERVVAFRLQHEAGRAAELETEFRYFLRLVAFSDEVEAARARQSAADSVAIGMAAHE